MCLPDHPLRKDARVQSVLVATAANDMTDLNLAQVEIIRQDNGLDSISSKLSSMLKDCPERGSTDLEHMKFKGKVLISLLEAHEPMMETCTDAQWIFIQRLLSSAKGVLWVTRGGAFDCKIPESGLITGLARTVRSDNQGLRLVNLDLDPTQKSAGETAKIISSVFQHSFGSITGGHKKDVEYVERDGQVLISRVVEDNNLHEHVRARTVAPATEIQRFFQSNHPLRLEVGTPGLLDSLRFVDDKIASDPLMPEELKVEFKASGVNFRDVMISLGQLSESCLMAGEYSGVVTEVGSNMVDRFRVGDRVCGFGGTAYASCMRVNGISAQHIPVGMDFETAASIPVAFATVYYSLVHVARLKRGETILIHSAAGGVGQAAIALSQYIGADIFVTVGNNEKKALIVENFRIAEEQIFSSRETSFVQGIKRLTNGKGVNVILNSLAGEAFRETCNCLSTLGRFIEIGKREALTNARMEMRHFDRNITFASVDLSIVFTHDPQLGGQIIGEVLDLIQKGTLATIKPIKVLSLSELESAFRFIQAGKHVGKIVLKAEAETEVKVRPLYLIECFSKLIPLDPGLALLRQAHESDA